MGIYVNPSNKGFKEAVRADIYVDKTGLIPFVSRRLETSGKYLCVSRPRYFGKSMALDMLVAYYSCGCSSRELFRGLQVEHDPDFGNHLNKYAVIRLDIQSMIIEAGNDDILGYLRKVVIEELLEEYRDLVDKGQKRLTVALRKIYKATQKPFIFLIDEWDFPIRERANDEVFQERYLTFLNGLLKGQEYVALAYMTGILPIKKYNTHSSLNMFSEYSMTDQAGLEEYTGFTEDEVKALCKKYDMDFEEACSWYDGYTFRRVKHIYNPRSITEAMLSSYFRNYWTSTATYETLKIYIDMDFEGLREDIARMLGGSRVRTNTRNFQNDMTNLGSKDDVLTLLVHLGYLAYDADTMEVFIPNREILEEFEDAMREQSEAE